MTNAEVREMLSQISNHIIESGSIIEIIAYIDKIANNLQEEEE